jgi:predicted  nucleic acid-binding Zn-ribbon protein
MNTCCCAVPHNHHQHHLLLCGASPFLPHPQEKAEQERLAELEKAAEAAKEAKEKKEVQEKEEEVEKMQQQDIQGDDLKALEAVNHMAREVGGSAAGVLLRKEEEASEMCLD